MKILLVTELYLPLINGVVTSTSTLCDALKERGHDVRVLTLSKQKSFENSVYCNKAMSIDKIYPDAYVSFSFDKEFYASILEWKPDIIHTQSEFTTMLFAKKIAKALSVPIVHTYHTSYEDYTHYIFLPKSMGKSFVAFVLGFILKPIKHIIAPTEKIQTMLIEYGFKTPISIIPTGIRLNFPILDTSEKQALKKSLNIGDEKKIFLSLGRIAKEKNIDCLLEYFAKPVDDSWLLLIAGGGPYLEDLQKKVKELKIEDKVRFTGMIPREEVYKYYQLGDIFTSASTSETQGLTYIEALANSTPLLCKYDICLDDVLLPDRNGFFFTTFEEFTANAHKLLESINHSNIKECAKESVQKYSTQNFAQSVENVYLKAIEN